MPLVFAGVCSHAPGITGRAERADPDVRDQFYANFRGMHDAMMATKPDALLVVGAEAAGVDADWIEAADHHVRIPLRAPVESLNAAVAAGVLLFEAQRQRTDA